MRVIVTGIRGFVGSHLARHLTSSRHQVVAQTWTDEEVPAADVFVHCAGLAHKEASAEEHRNANFHLPVRMAEAARNSGVRRFVFVSTINVVAGNSGTLKPEMPYAPISTYGEAKAQAEQALLAIPGIEVVIVRPPLVYGPGANGNLRSLMRLIDNPLPMPFRENQRSMVGVSNLASALTYLAGTERKVDREIFHVTDGPVSTAEIAYWARVGMGREPRIAPFLAPVARGVLTPLSKRLANQLFGNLLVDGTKLLNLGWIASTRRAEELVAMGRTYSNYVAAR